MTNVPALAADVPSRLGLIGFAAPLGDPMAQSALQAAQLAVDEANQHPQPSQHGTITFQLLPQDDKNNPNIATYVARYFDKAQVLGVVGHWTTAVALATAPSYEQAGVPQVNFNATSSQFTSQGYKTAFRVLGSTDNTASNLAEAMDTELHGKRVAIIRTDTQFSQGLADALSAHLGQRNIKVARQEIISAKTSDFNTALRGAVDSGADVIFLAAITDQLVPFVQAARRLDVAATIVLTGGAVNQAMDYKGRLYTLEPDVVPDSCWRQKSFRQNYTSRFNRPPTTFARHAFDATNVLIQAARQSDSVAARDVVAALRTLRYTGLNGEIAFDAAGNAVNPGYALFRSSPQGWQQVRTFPRQLPPTRCPRERS